MPIGPSWMSLVWATGGVPLALLASAVNLRALPVSRVDHRRVLRTLVAALAVSLAAAILIALPAVGGALGVTSLGAAFVGSMAASRCAGLAAYVAERGRLRAAYRTHEFWGGEVCLEELVVPALPMLFGAATDVAVYLPVVWLVMAVGGAG